jgi:hypothetical protein
MKEIYKSDYFVILVDDLAGIVRTVRSAAPFPSIGAVLSEFDQFLGALDALDRARYVLLCDIRAAPGRNDPEFEQIMADVRLRWLAGFRRVGVLVQTVTGALQIKRYAKNDGVERLITSDEPALMKYLAS